MPPPDRWSDIAALAEQRLGVRDQHLLFVGRNDPCRCTAGRCGDAGAVAKVGRLIQLDAEPRRLQAHALTYRRAVLADAAGENERIETTECCRQSTELACDAADEEVAIRKVQEILRKRDAVNPAALAGALPTLAS